MGKKKYSLFLTLLIILLPEYLSSAVGCTLKNPDRDIKRIFPEATNYKTEFFSIKEKGGKRLKREIEEKLKDKLNPKYESLDTPYAYYTVYKNKKVIGRIHGVNQKGIFGGMQIILATNKEGKIIEFYYQKILSPVAKKFKSKNFRRQFIGLSLADFYIHDYMIKKEINDISSDKIVRIKPPSKKFQKDFLATLRGIKKNLILLDIFILKRRYESLYKKLLKNDKGGKDEK
jgi:hypothetical protein